MLEPYEGRDHYGMATMPVEQLNRMVQQANSGGISVVIHAIGDAANRKVVDAIELARSASEPGAAPLLPNRIEHAQIIQPSDIARFAPLGIIASMQPIHATSDMHMADELWGNRCAMAYALRSFHEAGVTLAFGSDAPVEALNPWLGIHAAVTRQRSDNTPPSGWYPAQRMSLHDTLRAYCVGPTIASNETGQKGKLIPGLLADMIILDADPFYIPSAQLHSVQVDMTIIEGDVKWERRH
jgi:hypothetical protein